MKTKLSKILLYVILVLALALRVYGIDWDQGTHLHPDERAIILSVTGLHVPSSMQEFLKPQSPWNTHFFAYGSFPFYLLRIAGNGAGLVNERLATYDGIQFVGRFLSALFDVSTVFVLFLLARKLDGTRAGLIAAFFYATAVLPIQLSHFFAVDTILTFLTTLLLLLSFSFYEKQSLKKALLIGTVLAIAMATKITAFIVSLTIASLLVIDFLLVILRRPHHIKKWQKHLPPFLKKLIIDGTVIVFTALIMYSVLSPYTFIDFDTFRAQTLEQSHMTKDAFTFPYTFQYVEKIPYVYELKNMFLYGLGPILAILSFAGFFLFLWNTIQKRSHATFAKHVLLLVFLVSYFGVVGGFAVGFMRYMLPLYPLLCLFGALMIERIMQHIHMRKKLFALCSLLFAFLLLLWPASFMSIYKKPHTRVVASDWIHSHIPKGSTIAVEHWDDSLPLSGIEEYKVLTYPLYEPDTKEKWDQMEEYIRQTDYIILSSNRLYVPLQKLTDCTKLPPGRCYTQTAFYYKMLFSGSLGFTKVAEFSSNPTVPLLGLQINDQGADESFTVYDHPKVLIFKRNTLP